MALSKKKIIRFISATLWIGAGIALVIFLIAAMRKRDDKVCSGLDIELLDVKNNQFADKNDIKGMLLHLSPEITGKPIGEFDLVKMEKTLEANVWIKDAELFFDNNEMLRVKIKEREPMARIFTTRGKSYYLDQDFVRLPLSTKFSARVPVFTGCPLDKTRWTATDSVLLDQVKAISNFVSQNNFWMAQVAQIDYNTEKRFELIPSIGNHVVVLGSGDDLDRKFNNLYIFYQEVLAKNGWNSYEKVDVQYKGQVVATPRNKKLSKTTIQNNSNNTTQ